MSKKRSNCYFQVLGGRRRHEVLLGEGQGEEKDQGGGVAMETMDKLLLL